jgi:hypothetical protein
MDEFPRPLPLIAADWFSRLQGTELIEPAPSQNTTDGGGRDAKFAGDLMLPDVAPEPVRARPKPWAWRAAEMRDQSFHVAISPGSRLPSWRVPAG